jgi:hypothetical protein
VDKAIRPRGFNSNNNMSTGALKSNLFQNNNI